MISSQATQNITCSGGVCAPTAKSAVLNVRDLENLLASGNVDVTTTGSGVQAGNLNLDSALAWSATNALELDAYRSIAVQKAVSVTGSGELTIVTNDGGTGGTFSFGPKGSITFQNLASPLTIDSVSFTLVNSLPTLASAVNTNPDGAFALANNYDASQDGTYTRAPIIQTLEGMIEGLGNTISHLSIAEHGRLSFAAMIETVGETGAVESLRLANVRIKDSGDLAGLAGLVVANQGYLFGDSVTGTVKGSDHQPQSTGGLAVSNSTTGTISSSWVNVHATAAGNGGAAGLVGGNSGTIELSHAAGVIVAGVAGGLVASNEGTISQSYSTASVDGGGGGGLVSMNQTGQGPGIIENSYATGNVSGGEVGGLLYEQAGEEISSSYATGAVASGEGGFLCNFGDDNFSSDYWDTTSSGTTYGI